MDYIVHGSAGKESACLVGVLGSITGLEDPLEMGQLCEADYNKSFKWLAKEAYLNEDCNGYRHPFPSFYYYYFFFNEWLYLQFQFPLKKINKETTAEKVSAILAPHFAICPIIFWAKNFEESTPEHSSWGLLCKD